MRGWELLGHEARMLTKDLRTQTHEIYSHRALEAFRQTAGLGYHMLYNRDAKAYLCENHRSYAVRFDSIPNRNSDLSYWTVSWNGLIENKATGIR